MGLVTVQDYATRYKVTVQSVYARIKSGSIKAVIQDGIKYVEDNIQDTIKTDTIQSDDLVKTQSRHIKDLKKEIKRLYKEIDGLKKSLDKADSRTDRLFEIVFARKDIAMTTCEIVDVAIEKKHKKKKKK